MGKLRVVVCGSTFGQYYIKALKTVPEEFEIIGLFATGSERSRKCAEFYKIPLYTNFDEIPRADLACVVVRSRAIGGSGTDLSERFLNKGIHVIQEQPIHPKDLEVCYRAAKKNQVLFQQGDLYPNLLEVKNFMKCARKLNETELPLYLKAAFSPQVSYPAVDILSRILPSIHTWKIEHLSKGVGPFDVLTGTLGKTPFLIEYHNQVNPKDPDNYMHLLHSISLVYPSGRLILEDTFGPVLWKPRMHVPKRLYIPEVAPKYPEYMLENSMEHLGNFRKRSFQKVITEEWPIAIVNDLRNLKKRILASDNGNKAAQQGLLRSKKWAEMTKIFGYAELMAEDHCYMPFSELSQAITEE